MYDKLLGNFDPRISWFINKELLPDQCLDISDETLLSVKDSEKVIFVNFHNFIDKTLDIVNYRLSKKIDTKIIFTSEEILPSLNFINFEKFNTECTRLFKENTYVICMKANADYHKELIHYFPYDYYIFNTLTTDLKLNDFDFLNNTTNQVKDRPNRINFLAGNVGTRPARFLASYYLWKHGLLQDSISGVLAEENDISEWIEKFNNLDYGNYYDVVKTKLGWAESKFTNHESMVWPDISDSALFWGFNHPYSSKIFRESSLSYVPETWDIYRTSVENLSDQPIPDKDHYRDNSMTFTEKIGKSLIFKHPFVLQGSPGMLKEFSKQGFQTFSSIIDESYNTYDKTDFSHVEPCVLAAKDFLNKLQDARVQSEVQEIVDFNFQHIFKRAEQTKIELNKSLNDFIKKPFIQ